MRMNLLFPTLVGDVVNPDPTLNARLAEVIRERQRNDVDQAPYTTVHGGWQSGLDLLRSDAPAILQLRSFFEEQIGAYLTEAGRCHNTPGAPTRFAFDYTGWAVVLGPGGFQHEHVHAGTQVVGVYWVAVPDEPAGRGDLNLGDPRGGRVASRLGWETDRIRLVPEAGRLILFPSYLPHRVEQVTGAGVRISINFDVTIHPT